MLAIVSALSGSVVASRYRLNRGARLEIILVVIIAVVLVHRDVDLLIIVVEQVALLVFVLLRLLLTIIVHLVVIIEHTHFHVADVCIGLSVIVSAVELLHVCAHLYYFQIEKI